MNPTKHHNTMSSFLLITIVVTYSLLSLSSSTTTATISCTSKSFTTEKFAAFDTCTDLPTLSAVLRWTYDPTTSALSIAFSAPPPTPDGWVSWALNPTGSGMVGAQSLIAFRPTSSDPVSVSTYDIQSYQDIVRGPISYNVTDVSAEESDGVITIFATWKLPMGSKTVNQVWQVGPVVNGRPGMHDFEPANLESMMKLAPVGSPVGSPGSGTVGESTPKPAQGGAVKIGLGVSSLFLGFGALFVSLF